MSRNKSCTTSPADAGDIPIRAIPTSVRAVALVVLCLWPWRPAGALSTASPAPPSVEFGELYRAVEMANLFADQKTFADAIALEPPAKVMADYDRQKRLPGFDLRAFVDRHFEPPHHFDVFRPGQDRNLRAYISDAWEALQRKPDETKPYSSLLPLGRPYVVPGGRFSEIYYWDSFFVMLELEQDGRRALARDMLDNIASLIDRYGHMPNGNRSYYLSRSEPPFFSCMVELIAAHDGEQVFVKYLPELRAEYDYWMDGADSLAPGAAYRHALRLSDGVVLNRYWDDRATPRDKSYAKTSTRRGIPIGPPLRSTGTCAPAPRPDGISVPAGSPTASTSGRFARPRSLRSISTP